MKSVPGLLLGLLCISRPCFGLVFRATATTRDLLRDTWSKGSFQRIPGRSASKTDVVQYVCCQGPKTVYLDNHSNRIVVYRDLMEDPSTFSTPGFITDLDLDAETDTVLAAHFSATTKTFTLSYLDPYDSKGWHHTPTAHLFPIKLCYFLPDGTLCSLASNGVLGFVKRGEKVVGYHDLPFVVRHAQFVGNELFLTHEDGIYLFDLHTRRLQDFIPRQWGDEDLSSFHVYAPSYSSTIRIVAGTVSGDVSVMGYNRISRYTSSEALWHRGPTAVGCYVDDYKCVLACGDGSLRIIDSVLLSEWHVFPNFFHPRTFKKMEITHKRVFCDSGVDGFCALEFAPTSICRVNENTVAIDIDCTPNHRKPLPKL